MKYFALLLIVTFSLQSARAQVIAPGIKPVLIDSSFSFTEGPAADKEGNVYFTDQPNDNIWKYSADGKLTLFMHGAGRSNGMDFDAKGNLVSCADGKNELISISPEKKITVLVKDFDGYTLNGPNDVWIDGKGGMYITDPFYPRPYWTRTQPDAVPGGENLYYLPPHGKRLQLADSFVTKPNGVVGTPDGKFLYVADMANWKTYRYEIQPNGTLSNKTVFANEASDGMTIDNQNNIYFTNRGVSIYNPAGEKIAHIEVPEKWTANVCFAGKNRDILFITASKSVYMIQTLVKGVK